MRDGRNIRQRGWAQCDADSQVPALIEHMAELRAWNLLELHGNALCRNGFNGGTAGTFYIIFPFIRRGFPCFPTSGGEYRDK